jgi:tetratricopeptide (TPR) repeat protein
VLLWSAGLVALACSGDRGGPPSTAAAGGATFVGREGCAACHAEEDELWSGSHHDLAMQEAGPGTVLGDFDDASFTYGDVTTTFATRDGRYVVRTDGADGALQDFEVAYTFGVEPLQQYLIALPGGRLQALGIAWDSRPRTDGGQLWFHLYPNEAADHRSVLHWTRFSQNWNLMCAECHSTDLRPNYDAAADRYETTWSELDVSCEACHGPGSRHVAWARAGGSGAPEPSLGLLVDLGPGDDAVWNVDPATGLATRSVPRRSQAEVETCARCHSRRASIHEDGHGVPLLDTHQPALLLDPLYFADGQPRDEVYVYGSFLQSRMYRQGVTCSDCHNPHTLRVGGDGNARCAGCHLPARFDAPSHHRHEAGSPGASCVACHMPATTFMGVDARRDHSFRVPRPDLTASIGVPNACASCHADRTAQWASEAVTRWHGPPEPHFAEPLTLARAGARGASAALASLAAGDAAPIVRATAVAELRGSTDPAARGAIDAAARAEEPLLRLAAVAALESWPPAARVGALAPLLADPLRAVRIEAARSLAAVPSTMLPEARRAERDRALEEYRAAQALHADRAESHVNLGVIAAGQRNLSEAEAAFETAIARNPFFVPAYVNLAEVYRIQARDEDAARLLADAIERVPDAADLHHALGLVRVRQGRRDAALGSLRRAAALAPGEPRYAYVLGVALNSDGQREAALAELRRAHEVRPSDRDVLLALATISRDSGALAESIVYARELVALSPEEPEARQLLSELERARAAR